MTISLPPAPADQTDQVAQNAPGFDPASVLDLVEQGILSVLSIPIQQILGGLPLQQFPQQQNAGAGDLANQIDPLGLITPVVNILPALGNGADPTQMFKGVSDALDGTAMPVQRALESVAQDWQGRSSSAADAKTREAVANGAEVATQADLLRANLSTAAGDVEQARMRIIDSIDEYQATIAAIDPSTPEGAVVAMEAAKQATTESAAVIEELEDTLAAKAAEVSTIGAPVRVANSPGAGGAMAGGMLSPLMGLARLDPSGVLGTVFGDPRLTPQGLAGNFMDLLFLPQTMTEMNQGIKTMNTTLGETNLIMTGLGAAMAGLDGRLVSLDGRLVSLDGRLDQTNRAVGSMVRLIPGMVGELQNAAIKMQGSTDAVNQNTEEVKKATTATTATGEEIVEMRKQLEGVTDLVPDWLKPKRKLEWPPMPDPQ